MKFSKIPEKHLLAGVPDSYAALVLAEMTRQTGDVVHICRDDMRFAALTEQLGFFAPDLDVLPFPAWDTVPYDRVSPNTDVVARRLETLSNLHAGKGKAPRLVVTTVNAVLQRVPPFDFFKASLCAEAGKTFDEQAFHQFLEKTAISARNRLWKPGNMPFAAVLLTCLRRERRNRCGWICSATIWKRSARLTR